jgi:hypothetical protein
MRQYLRDANPLVLVFQALSLLALATMLYTQSWIYASVWVGIIAINCLTIHTGVQTTRLKRNRERALRGDTSSGHLDRHERDHLFRKHRKLPK